MSLSNWRATIFSTDQREVAFGFGHDFRRKEVWIIEVSSRKKLVRISSDLTHAELELVGRLCRQAPVLADACREASKRLARATHPNAKALREVVAGALQGLEIPLSEEPSDRIDP